MAAKPTKAKGSLLKFFDIFCFFSFPVYPFMLEL